MGLLLLRETAFRPSRYAHVETPALLVLLVLGLLVGLRRPRRLGLVLCASLLVLPLGRRAFHPSKRDLVAEGDGYYAAILASRDSPGRWPESLDEAGCTPRCELYGGWRMIADDHGLLLSIGDHELDGFVVIRYPGEDWYVDT